MFKTSFSRFPYNLVTVTVSLVAEAFLPLPARALDVPSQHLVLSAAVELLVARLAPVRRDPLVVRF